MSKSNLNVGRIRRQRGEVCTIGTELHANTQHTQRQDWTKRNCGGGVLQCHSGYWWGGKTWNPDTPPGLWVCMQFGKYVSAWWGAGAFNMAGFASWDDAHYAGVVAWRGGGSGARETTVMARTTTSSQSESWVERGGGLWPRDGWG